MRSALIVWLALGLLQTPQPADQGQAVYARAAESVLLIVVQDARGNIVGQGSAFVIAGGRLVTNAHVVRGGAPFVRIGPLKIACTVERLDEINDLALLKPAAEISGEPLPLALTPPSAGARVFAIGNPQGLERTISEGLLAGPRMIGQRSLLQISAPVSPGSSGGPVLSADGNVIGVIVSGLKDAQNLNFAVPAAAVKALMNSPGVTLGGAIANATSIAAERAKLPYSSDENSEWWQLLARESDVLKTAQSLAHTADEFLQVYASALKDHRAIALEAATRALDLAKPADDRHYAAVAKASQHVASLKKGREREDVLKDALTAAQKALTLRSTAANLFLLADVQEDAGLNDTAYVNFQKVVEGRPGDNRTAALAGLVRTARALKRKTDAVAWFRELEAAGAADDWDRAQQATFLYDQSEFGASALLFESLAKKPRQLSFETTTALWSQASVARWMLDELDAALADARMAVATGAIQKDSETDVATAQLVIAAALNRRGVFEQATAAARQAIELDPERWPAYGELARGLNGMQRYAEAESAAKSALALSDGKYAGAHFQLGSAYFGQQKWPLARQSYLKAAELDSSDSSASYNVAVSYYNDGYFAEAIRWYEETLRRDPKRDDRPEIFAMISRLKRR